MASRLPNTPEKMAVDFRLDRSQAVHTASKEDSPANSPNPDRLPQDPTKPMILWRSAA